jgi:hypothetical protein
MTLGVFADVVPDIERVRVHVDQFAERVFGDCSASEGFVLEVWASDIDVPFGGGR